MTAPDFKADRESSAGDDFHEPWALRRSLAAFSVRLEDIGTAAQIVSRV